VCSSITRIVIQNEQKTNARVRIKSVYYRPWVERQITFRNLMLLHLRRCTSIKVGCIQYRETKTLRSANDTYRKGRYLIK